MLENPREFQVAQTSQVGHCDWSRPVGPGAERSQPTVDSLINTGIKR